MTELRLLQEIVTEAPLHRETGGGVTFTGGEPLLQAEFLFRLLEGCRALDIHTAVDTCGAAAPYAIERVAGGPLTDPETILKHVDDEGHRRITGIFEPRDSRQPQAARPALRRRSACDSRSCPA